MREPVSSEAGAEGVGRWEAEGPKARRFLDLADGAGVLLGCGCTDTGFGLLFLGVVVIGGGIGIYGKGATEKWDG